MSDVPADILAAPYVFTYTYRRSVGPIIGRFLTSLRSGRIEGAKTDSGKVIVPPTEYDPATGEAVGDFVELAQVGTVETYAWVSEPRRFHPLDRPFAFAMIKLDGADTAMLHAVDAGERNKIKRGTRVKAKWREERVGSITDIECFELEEASS